MLNCKLQDSYDEGKDITTEEDYLEKPDDAVSMPAIDSGVLTGENEVVD